MSSMRSVQEHVDDICFSVPFHLGNRYVSSSISDFVNPTLMFPSHHNNTHVLSAEISTIMQSKSMSGSEHKSHVIAQGAWHILIPLGQLVSLLSDHLGHILLSALREGQLQWILEQFSRSLHVLGPVGHHTTAPDIPVYSSSKHRCCAVTVSTAETHVRQVRNSMTFTSGT